MFAYFFVPASFGTLFMKFNGTLNPIRVILHAWNFSLIPLLNVIEHSHGSKIKSKHIGRATRKKGRKEFNLLLQLNIIPMVPYILE